MHVTVKALAGWNEYLALVREIDEIQAAGRRGPWLAWRVAATPARGPGQNRCKPLARARACT
jgi:hypothetical protein